VDWVGLFKDIVVPIVVVGVIPFGVFVLKSITDLKVQMAKAEGKQDVLDEKINHIEKNYKQGIDYLNKAVDEIKADIKELLKKVVV